MLRARHALPSGQHVNGSIKKIPQILTRFRSRAAYQERLEYGGRPSDGFHQRAGPTKGLQKPTVGKLWARNPRSFEKRTELANTSDFAEWLEQHLKMLVAKYEHNDSTQTPENEGFAIFLKNLVPVLKKPSTLRALDEEVKLSFDFEHKWQPTEQKNPLLFMVSLKMAFAVKGKSGVDEQLRYTYTGLVAGRNLSKADLEDQKRIADLRYPTEWYPAARQLTRKIHLHVGPTNSGKTYHALKRLEQASTGLYAGPLRLLAYEVYTRLNAQGTPCDLLTGDEQIIADNDGPRMISSTVEMVPLGSIVDVAVIDEIQMIGDDDRGWAWTQALLGVRAKELHLCGETRSVQLIREIVASTGDELEVHTYKRLTPLKTMSTSLHGDLHNLRKGDCLVVFSRVGIHAMRNQIERVTGKRVAIIYGSLPPEVRAQQAAFFNDPDNDYDILVASDAIGMGLNLAIKRIVFETTVKFNGKSLETMHASQIKQIAGRAGRYRIAPQSQTPAKLDSDSGAATTQAIRDLPAPSSNIGLVTTFESRDLPILLKAMKVEEEPIKTAGLLPPFSVLEDFARYFHPSIRFSYVLRRLKELCQLGDRYQLCRFRDQAAISDAIHSVQGLSVFERNLFCLSPTQTRDPGMIAIILAFAKCVEGNTRGALLSIPEIPLEVLDEEARPDREYVHRLEILHKALVLYLWLSYRFAGVFLDQEMAFYVKKLAEERIDTILGDFSASKAIHRRIQALKQRAIRKLDRLNEVDLKSEDQIHDEDVQLDEERLALVEGKAGHGEDGGLTLEVPIIGPELMGEQGPVTGGDDSVTLGTERP